MSTFGAKTLSAFVLTICASPVFSASPAFDMEVKPILKAKCIACHAGADPKGKLNLESVDGILRGGASGPAVIAGSSEKSLLVMKIVNAEMPPIKGARLSDKDIDTLRAWIDQSLPALSNASAAQVKEHEVRAIFQVRCVACHGGSRKEGGLDLRTIAGRIKGGKSGPALVPGKPEESLLYKRMASGEMPPAKLAKELAVELPTAPEQEKIRLWIARGATGPEAAPVVADTVKDSDRQFWSFQSPKRPDVPKVKAQAMVRNPIDAFLLAKLESKGMRYSSEADRLTLMRRVYLDLVGVLPTPAEVEAYEKDKSPGAYERLVDRLLASPHFGERWGQHWLDLAGYSDSEGFGQDDGVRAYAWRYRDYVIRSLNADKPYDQFLIEQIAGDELSNDWKNVKGDASPEMIERLAATGFLRNTPDPTDSNERGLIAERMNVLADEVEVLATSVMGVTIGCARCHNHKYDPIPQRDYYRLSAILQSAYDPYEWKTPKARQVDLSTEAERKELAERNAPVQAQIKKLQEQIDQVAGPFRRRAIEEKIADLPPDVRDDVRALQQVPADQRTELQKNLAEKFKTVFEVSPRDLQKYPEYQGLTQPLQRELQSTRRNIRGAPNVRVLADNEEHSMPYLLQRGDPVNYGEPLAPDVPSVLKIVGLKPYEPVSPFPGTSGRRLAFARWLTQPNHPLTARVMVNQMWLRHFVRGIVPTASNFGHSGALPSNQQLLDWLATEFVRGGWSMKSIHRLMVTSQAYRQSSRVDPAVAQADPDNALVSRMPLRRMDAETLWDSLLQASGRLDTKMYGWPAEVDVRPDKEVTVKVGRDGVRRSIYILHKRANPVSLLDAFDQPPMTPNCVDRRQSNVATQALHMMNGSMTWDLARNMAGRVIDESGGDQAREIEAVYMRAFSRRPSEKEIRLGAEAIADFAKQWPERLAADNNDAPRTVTAHWLALANYCHVLINSAEFSFVD